MLPRSASTSIGSIDPMRTEGWRDALRYNANMTGIDRVHAAACLHTVRLATPEEARTIAEMSRDYIEQGLGWSWTGSRVLAAIRDRCANVAVVCDRDRIIAFGIMQYGEQTAHLALLGVHAAHRQRGLGTAVLTWLEECADTAGIAHIRLEARADNPVAITFYLRQGYRVVSRITGYYRGSLDALRLEKPLWIP